MTKIMNEGWASYWHSKMMTQNILNDSEIIDFADAHSGTMAMSPNGFNPYKVGIELFRDIEERWNKGQFGKEWNECDDIREKIAAHLRNPAVTQASFCRELTKCQGNRPDRGGGKGGPLQPVQLQSFLKKEGPLCGNTSKAFYTAYVYFEKMNGDECMLL